MSCDILGTQSKIVLSLGDANGTSIMLDVRLQITVWQERKGVLSVVTGGVIKIDVKPLD